MEPQSIIEVLPEDILVLILSEYGLHASLGSVCRSMYKLSTSGKALGSVCVRINNKNKNADPSYVLSNCAYRLTFEPFENHENIHLNDDRSWPYLTEFIIKATYNRYKTKFPKIYCPRLVTFIDEYKSAFGYWNNCFNDMRKRAPMVVPFIEYLVSYEMRFGEMINYGTQGLVIDTYDLYILHHESITSYANIILKKEKKIIKFIDCICINDYYLKTQDGKIDFEFIQLLFKITIKEIRIYLNQHCEKTSIDTNILDYLDNLYNWYFNHTSPDKVALVCVLII